MEAYQAGKLGKAEPAVMVADSHHAGAINVARELGVYATFVPRTAYHANREGFEKRLLEVLAPLEIEFVVLAGFQRLLSSYFLSHFPLKVINVHPALLPAFPGHAVWSKELAYGVKLAGATVHFVDEGVDSGPIIIQGAVPVVDGDSEDELAQRILAIEHKILPQAICWYSQGRLAIEERKVKVLKTSQVVSAPKLIWPPLD
jgi:phosphoribosylglycinamide formyltransferase-1